jgi:hypothetical protein
MNKIKLWFAAFVAAVGLTTGAVVLDVQPAAAATYMGVGSYWYANDAKMYCNVVVNNHICTGGSTAGYWLVKYPGSSSYCYRRNANYIETFAGGYEVHFSGSLYYIC